MSFFCFSYAIWTISCDNAYSFSVVLSGVPFGMGYIQIPVAVFWFEHLIGWFL